MPSLKSFINYIERMPRMCYENYKFIVRFYNVLEFMEYFFKLWQSCLNKKEKSDKKEKKQKKNNFKH